MAAECYICIAVGTTQSVSSVQGTLGSPLGSCYKCGVLACGHHALRLSSPQEYQCTVCVPSHIAPPPGRGGGPTGGPKGPGGAGLPQVSERVSQPYTEEEFAATFPTAHTLLRKAVKSAVEDPATVLLGYFGENFRELVASAFAIEGEVSFEQMTQVAAAVAVIQYAGIQQEHLSNHLRERPEEQIKAKAEAATS